MTPDTIANWFLQKEAMSPKKLQKLVYYAYAWNLVINHSKLFDEPFGAWVHGPTLFSLFKKYKEIDLIPQNPSLLPSDLSPKTIDLLNQVWTEYGQYNQYELESIVHQEDPWLKARGQASPIENCYNFLKDEDIKKYYKPITA